MSSLIQVSRRRIAGISRLSLCSRSSFHTSIKLNQEVIKTSSPSTQAPRSYETPKDLASFGEYRRHGISQEIDDELANKSALLVTLHTRLGLPQEFKLSTLSRCLKCRGLNDGVADNYGLNIFGKNLLSYYVSEYLITKYPRLPITILNASIDSYIGVSTLQQIAKEWGLEADDSTKLEKFLANEPSYYALGKIRFSNSSAQREAGVTEIGSATETNTMNEYHAFAGAVRSIVGGLYAHTKDEKLTKKFIYDHILSRKVDVDGMFEFRQPAKELNRLCENKGMETPVARLIAETGRLSASPVFIVGIFSGNEKLGEGQGASLIEAKTRACVQSLKGYYLYEPLRPKLPSDSDYEGVIEIDNGEVVI